MTLSDRNSIMLAGIVLAVCMCLLSAAVFFYSLAQEMTMKDLRLNGTELWWMIYGNAAGKSPAWILPAIFCTALFSAAAGYTLRRFFWKTVSFEMFFFTLFILSISLDSVRIFQLAVKIWNGSPYFGVLLSRVSYLGNFFGMFSLFVSSLYAMNVQYQKIGNILGISFFLSFAIAVSMPFDITVLLRNLLYRTSFENGLFTLVTGFSLFTILNFIRAGFLRGMKEYWMIIVAVVFVLTGRSLLFFLGSPVSVIAGAVLLISGTVIFGKRLHSLYLWV